MVQQHKLWLLPAPSQQLRKPAYAHQSSTQPIPFGRRVAGQELVKLAEFCNEKIWSMLHSRKAEAALLADVQL